MSVMQRNQLSKASRGWISLAKDVHSWHCCLFGLLGTNVLLLMDSVIQTSNEEILSIVL